MTNEGVDLTPAADEAARTPVAVGGKRGRSQPLRQKAVAADYSRHQDGRRTATDAR
jgi:hypothetical protein